MMFLLIIICRNISEMNDFISDAGSGFVVGSALIANWNANSLGVEDPFLRAFEAGLVVPIPGIATEIRRTNDFAYSSSRA